MLGAIIKDIKDDPALAVEPLLFLLHTNTASNAAFEAVAVTDINVIWPY
jgi:hypothetical protein